MNQKKIPDLKIHKGDPEKELIIMVHGWATDIKTFTDPLKISWVERVDDELTEILPIKYFISAVSTPDVDNPLFTEGDVSILSSKKFIESEVVSIWDCLAQKGYNLLGWSQFYPNKCIDYAVNELAHIITAGVKEFFPSKKSGSILTHSRGALVTRKFIQQFPEYANPFIKRVYMVAPPNIGSKIGFLSGVLQEVVRYFDPDVENPVLKKILSQFSIFNEENGSSRYVLDLAERLLHFIQGEAIKELSVTSEFIKSLNKNVDIEKSSKIEYHIFSGKNPFFSEIYVKYKDKIVPLIEPFSKFFAVVSELRDNCGDGLVAVKRSKVGFEKSFQSYYANHATILFNTELQDDLVSLLDGYGE
ncbi:hypothetical protein KAJ27_09000 [bacterium]|nr:hypothetical protein [bacterium]